MNTLHPVWLIVFAAGISLLPVVLGLCTAYIKVSIVIGMLRNALGAQQVPGNLVVLALSLSLTAYVMGPVANETLQISEKLNAIELNTLPAKESLEQFSRLLEPWRDFMQKHSGKREIKSFSELQDIQPAAASLTQLPKDSQEAAEGQLERVPLNILFPAFVVSELKEAFAMAFVVLLPFLVIDLIVANLLTGLGMAMVSPVLVALPVKLILFVLADGWLLLARSLVLSYQA